MNDNFVCPNCKSDSGVYTTIKAIQYYKWDGEPNGLNIGGGVESEIARCISCNKEFSLQEIKERNKE